MEEKPATNQATPSAGPGEFLGETRRALGLEPDNIAQILHLSRHHIVSLEANDFDSLPEPTYVRGYLRSYSQLLNVDPAPVIKSYNEAVGGWKTTTYSSLAVERQISSNDNVIRFATYGVMGVVFSLAIVWWLGEEDASTALPPPTEMATVPSRGSESVTNTTAKDAPDSAPESNITLPADFIPVEKLAVKTPVEGVNKIPQITAEKESPPTKVNVTADQVISARKANPTVAAGVRATLVMRTDGPSWTDIRDANDTKLLYETVAAGRVITIVGEAPLKVFFGNANVVTLELDGEAYDFNRFKRGLTARFVVGSAKTGNDQ